MAQRSSEQLKKAEGFLRLAEEQSETPDLFRLFFEVFIAFARSVIHVLKKEVEKASVWTCFEPEWKRLGTEQLPEFFRKSRNLLLKEGTKGESRTRKVVTEIVTSGLLLNDSAEVEIASTSGEAENANERHPVPT